MLLCSERIVSPRRGACQLNRFELPDRHTLASFVSVTVTRLGPDLVVQQLGQADQEQDEQRGFENAELPGGKAVGHGLLHLLEKTKKEISTFFGTRYPTSSATEKISSTVATVWTVTTVATPIGAVVRLSARFCGERSHQT